MVYFLFRFTSVSKVIIVKRNLGRSENTQNGDVDFADKTISSLVDLAIPIVLVSTGSYVGFYFGGHLEKFFQKPEESIIIKTFQFNTDIIYIKVYVLTIKA